MKGLTSGDERFASLGECECNLILRRTPIRMGVLRPQTPTCAAARRRKLTPITVGAASSALLPGGITTRKVGWAWPGAPLGLACVQSVVRLRRFSFGAVDPDAGVPVAAPVKCLAPAIDSWRSQVTFFVDSGAGQCLCSVSEAFTDLQPCHIGVTGLRRIHCLRHARALGSSSSFLYPEVHCSLAFVAPFSCSS